MLYKRGFTRTASFDGLNYHNGKKFSTYDNNNDKDGANSAINFFGAWWFSAGCISSLDELYYPARKMSPNRNGTNIPVLTGIHWSQVLIL